MNPRRMTQAEKHALSVGDRFLDAFTGNRATVSHAYSEAGRRCAYVAWDSGSGGAYGGVYSLAAMDLWTTAPVK